MTTVGFRGAGNGRQECDGLLLDPWRLSIQGELLDVLPTRLRARADMRTR